MRRRRNTSMSPIASISMTSMMDVTFNLLIAFMIVAPTLKHGLEMDLPEVTAGNLKPGDSISIVIRTPPHTGEDERIYINDKRVTLDDLTEKVKELYESKPDMDVMIEADKSIPYEVVIRVLSATRNAGILNVGLVTEPESSL